MSAVRRIQGVHRNWPEVLREHQASGLLSCQRPGWRRTTLGRSGELCATSIRRRQSNGWNHKIVNVLAKLPKRQQDQAASPAGGRVFIQKNSELIATRGLPLL